MSVANVLVIEDDEGVRSVLVRALEREGYTVIAESGQQHIDLDDYQKQDVLISDVILPVETGYEIAERCRQKWHDCETILLSGHSVEELARRGVPPGTQIVQKPVAVSELTKLVEKVLTLRAWRTLRTDTE